MLSKAIALRPEYDPLWNLQRLWLPAAYAQAELSRWELAAADLTREIEQNAANPTPRLSLAIVHLAGGDIDAYRRDCAGLLHDFGQTNNPLLANAVAWTCVLEPRAVDDVGAVVRWRGRRRRRPRTSQ